MGQYYLRIVWALLLCIVVVGVDPTEDDPDARIIVLNASFLTQAVRLCVMASANAIDGLTVSTSFRILGGL